MEVQALSEEGCQAGARRMEKDVTLLDFQHDVIEAKALGLLGMQTDLWREHAEVTCSEQGQGWSK